MLRLLYLLPLASICSGFLVLDPLRTPRVASKALSSSSTEASFSVSDSLKMVLKKPSKTLSVVLEFDSSNSEKAPTDGDLLTISMQLRKLKAAALLTSDLKAASVFAEEQETAKGNFPGPCPIIYAGSDIQSAVGAGVAAIIVDAGDSEGGDDIDRILRVDTVEQVQSVNSNAFLIDGDAPIEELEKILDAIPNGAVVMARLTAMQDDNAELDKAKALKEIGVSSILLSKACVGDAEDLEYSSFIVDGMTKKKSSTFNMSGLTGNVNGHFGGVASTQATTWRRMKL